MTLNPSHRSVSRIRKDLVRSGWRQLALEAAHRIAVGLRNGQIAVF
jgi:hypothetical protein